MDSQKKIPKKIYYFSSTHWDREWYKTYQQFRVRLVDRIDEILDVLETNPKFTHFTMDGQTSVLDDYIEIMPENISRLKKLIADKKISIGPWYTQPDEYLISGESLIQNLILGHKKSKEYGSKAMKYGYIPDTFGHIAQLPQILNGFGIKSALVGRGVCDGTFPAFFIWQSPDKSECTTYKVSERLGYGTFFSILHGYLSGKNQPIENSVSNLPIDEEQAFKKAIEFIEEELERTHLPFVVLMDGLDHQPIHEKGVIIADKISNHYNCKVVFDSLEELELDLAEYIESLPVKTGELNKCGKLQGITETIRYTLSSRYDIKKSNDITQNILEKHMLPLSALARLYGNKTPRSYENTAYKYLAENHAHDSICGCSVDGVHEDMHHRFKQANEIAQEITTKSAVELMEIDINAPVDAPQILKILNPLFIERTETITVDIVFDLNYKYKNKISQFALYDLNCFIIKDIDGTEIPYQINSVQKNVYYKVPNGWQSKKGDIYTLTFNAKLPPNSTAIYNICPIATPTRYLQSMQTEKLQAENEYIKLKINQNGTFNIYDKRTGKSYNELNSFEDNSDIGDGWRHMPAIEDSLCYSDGAPTRIEKVNDGPCSITFKITKLLSVPNLTHRLQTQWKRSDEYKTLEITSCITLGSKNEWVDVETILNNNIKDHRLKVLFPTGIDSDEYYASQAFAIIKRSTGSDLNTGKWKEFDKPENNFEGIVLKKDTSGNGLAFISAFGLHECEARTDKMGTMAITLLRAVGQTAFTNGQPNGQLQGELKYKYRLFPFSSDNCFGDMVSVKDKLRAEIISISGYSNSITDTQPSRQPGFSFNSKDLAISVLKSSEDSDNSIIVRVSNFSDADANGEFNTPFEITSMYETNLLEEKGKKIKADKNSAILTCKPWQIKTYRIDLVPKEKIKNEPQANTIDNQTQYE